MTGLRIHVAEQRDFILDVLGQEAFGAAQQDVGLDTDGAQFLHAVLGRLGLELLGRGDPGHERDVNEQAIGAAEFVPQLPDGLQERQATRCRRRFRPDFADHDVHVAGDFLHGGLDLVGDVRDHLYGLSQVVAAALLGDDLLVDAPGGEIVGLGQAGVGEAFVMAQVQVRLGAVVGDEDLAVLERGSWCRDRR